MSCSDVLGLSLQLITGGLYWLERLDRLSRGTSMSSKNVFVSPSRENALYASEWVCRYEEPCSRSTGFWQTFRMSHATRVFTWYERHAWFMNKAGYSCIMLA